MAWVVPNQDKLNYSKRPSIKGKNVNTPKKRDSTSDKTLQTLYDMFSKQSIKRKRPESDIQSDNNSTNEKVEEIKENLDPQTEKQEFVNHIEKRVKVTDDEKADVPKPPMKKTVMYKKCEYCRQRLNENLMLYEGHPNGAVEEQIALIDPKLCIFTGEESDLHEIDLRPQHRLTYFSVYDKNGHLCAFDTGLIEKNVSLYVSGYMKPIYEEDSSPEGGIPTMDIGPINEWYVSGFDGGELALVGFVTAFAEYILMEPSESYAPFMDDVKEKIYISKIVIEYLLEEEAPNYEDLVNKLQTVVPPKGVSQFTEDALLRHAQFVCDQVLSLDDTAGPEDVQYITSSCMRTLASLAGVIFGKKGALRRTQRKVQKVKQPAWSKATTTQLVNDMFENIFADQLAKDDEKIAMGPKRHRCGVCENCQQADCGACSSCKDMIKFGGSGRSKQACIKRRCPNMAIQEAEDSDPELEEDYDAASENQKVENLDDKKKDFKELRKDISWIGKQIASDSHRTFYKTVMVGDEKINVNDYVLIEPKNPTKPLHIAKIIYMWESKNGTKQFHANWFHRGNNTVLGETSDPNELFLSDDCDDVPFRSIRSKCTVIRKNVPDNWAELGNMELSLQDEMKNKDGKTFFYKMRYVPETVRFEDPAPDPECPRKETSHRFCPACARVRAREVYSIPTVHEKGEEKSSKEVIYNLVKYKGEEFRVGSGVFLKAGTFNFTFNLSQQETTKMKKAAVDEDMYPEYYRKSSEHVKGSNYDTPEPFCIGYIRTIYATTQDILVAPSDIYIKVNKLYRPENTHKKQTLIEQVDVNMIYWSDEVCNVSFMDVTGKCYLAYSENLNEPPDEWSARGPYRFFFTEAYDSQNKTFDEPPYYATTIPKCSKTTSKGSKTKGKKTENSENKFRAHKIPDYAHVTRKLRCLDVFAGCGGLTEGLHQAGIAETLWAIEKEEPAAYAYSLNNPKATVFKQDCNTLLRKVMNGDKTDNVGQVLPQKGQVELLCGGPPCQGFSGMNRFNSRQYSLFKSSLVVSYLSYCDYYRPKLFVMENVRNFVSFKRSMVLKLTLRCLVRMGYQCTVGILQAGNYGVPQTRRRMILMAAAPGQALPKYPEPTHVFSKRACQLSILVDNRKYTSNCEWTDSAPYRTISVRDAMSDLPAIKNGWNKEEIPYNSEPISHFQRKMRGKLYQPMLKDHICKEMTPLVEARMAHIPVSSGSDWRDLPNIVLKLSDGSFCKKLEYTYPDKKAGRSTTGANRGVCSCAAGRQCDPGDRQFNTLIPWCLPHTGNRHNHWAGLYGRLEWEGFFSTTITNPEPMGKQGRVLHPTQTRVVSVRECARSQGFPDSFRFYGTILDKHRQVGNAVPPPLAAALGHEIRKCLPSVDPEDIKDLVTELETKLDIDKTKSQEIKKNQDRQKVEILPTEDTAGCSSSSQCGSSTSTGI